MLHFHALSTLFPLGSANHRGVPMLATPGMNPNGAPSPRGIPSRDLVAEAHCAHPPSLHGDADTGPRSLEEHEVPEPGQHAPCELGQIGPYHPLQPPARMQDFTLLSKQAW
jgi:hypothetical protein